MPIFDRIKRIFSKDETKTEKVIPSNTNSNSNVVSLFKEKKLLMHKAIAKWYGEPGIDFVLVPVLYAFFDYSMFLHQKDRSKYSKMIEDYVMQKEYKTKEQKSYHMQVLSVFGTVVNGNSVRGDWWLSSKRASNPVFSSMLFLGDLLLNKEMVTNYKKAPVMLIDASLLMEFGQIMMKEIYPEMMNAFDFLHDLD